MLVGACYTEAEVRRQKDEQVRQKRKREKQITFEKFLNFYCFYQFRGIVSQMEKTVQGWESRSCPIIRLESNCWIEF